MGYAKREEEPKACEAEYLAVSSITAEQLYMTHHVVVQLLLLVPSPFRWFRRSRPSNASGFNICKLRESRIPGNLAKV